MRRGRGSPGSLGRRKRGPTSNFSSRSRVSFIANAWQYATAAAVLQGLAGSRLGTMAACVFFVRQSRSCCSWFFSARRSAAATSPAYPPAEWILDQVRVLSAPDMEGRGSGTPGGDRAAALISSVFREAGLTPGGDGGGFLQVFAVPGGTRSAPPTQTANVVAILPGTRSPVAA